MIGTLTMCLFFLLIAPVMASDTTVVNSFTEAEKYASQQKSFSDKNKEDKQSKENIQHLKSMTEHLTAPQLVELLRLSRQKMREEIKHPAPYLNFFQSVAAFCIRRLGDIPTKEASECLAHAHELVVGHESLSVVWDESQQKQDKLMSLSK